MKKSLIAASVLAAATSVAQAQNVSIYGVLDTSVANMESGSFSNMVVLSGAHSTSRFGVRGSEDLGGGLRANFGMEAALLSDTGYFGTTPTTTVAASNRIFSRGISVGLSGGFGAIDLGSIASSANAFQFAYAAGIGGNYDVVTARNAVFGGYATAWKDNSVRYTSPMMNGFQAILMYSLGSTTTLQGAARDLPGGSGSEGTTEALKKGGQGTDVRLTYTQGPLTAGVFTAQSYQQNSGTISEKQQGAGIQYSITSALRAGASFIKEDPNDAVVGDTKRATNAAVSYLVNPALTIGVTYASLFNEVAAGDRKGTVQSLNAHYALSKRTTAYGYWVKVSNNANGVFNIGGLGQSGTSLTSPLPAVTAGQDPTALGIGVRHSF